MDKYPDPAGQQMPQKGSQGSDHQKPYKDPQSDEGEDKGAKNKNN